MEESVKQQLIEEHYLFPGGNKKLEIAGLERDWPEGRGIFLNKNKTFLLWINEEDHLRIISMQDGKDVKQVFERLINGVNKITKAVKEECGEDFMLDERYGYVHCCPSNLGTGLRGSVLIELPGWDKEGMDKLKARCEQLSLQYRNTYGDCGKQTGMVYDISNKHRLGYSEVELVQTMMDGVNILYKEDLELQKKHGV
jgi:creatine kinase